MRFIIIILFLTVAVQGSLAQTDRRSDRRGESAVPGLPSSLQQSLEGDSRTLRAGLAFPLEETVDPQEYLVGPNDVFNLLVVGTFNTPIQLIVSPEGDLIIPGAGDIHVDGETLATVKQRVVAEVRKVFRISQPSFTLFSPRQFIVNVTGEVRKPGPYVASATMRVDKVLRMANLLPDDLPPEQIKPLNNSTRKITIRRNGMPDRLVDLDRFFVEPVSEHNPFLREGDVIFVPQKSLEQSAVSVYGAVNVPNQYEYRETDSLVGMIRLAGGMTANADPSNVEITRLSMDAARSEITVVDITAILEGSRPDLPVQDKDRILVRHKRDRRMDYKVHVRGEVMMPGMYPVTPDSTRLSEVIRRAGGLTKDAYLPNAEVERKQLTAAGDYVDLGREALLNLRMNDQLVTPEERAYYDLEASLRRGTVAVDFVALLERGDRSQDIFLKDGDLVFIPNAARTVYVYGQVARPGFVSYKEGADLRYYVAQAGGYGEEADGGGSRVIKWRTREWVDPSDTTIEPGDYIWVPKEIRYPTGYYLNLVSQAASFVSVVLSMTVIILQLTRN